MTKSEIIANTLIAAAAAALLQSCNPATAPQTPSLPRITAPKQDMQVPAAMAAEIALSATPAYAVDFEFSPDSGETWKTISSNSLNQSDYNCALYIWTTPDSVSQTCMLRMINRETGEPACTSGVFALENCAIQSPEPDAQLVAGKTHVIKWRTSKIADAVILFSADNGVSWEHVSENAVLDSDSLWGKFPWNVPVTVSAACMIQIHEYEGPSEFYFSSRFSIVESDN